MGHRGSRSEARWRVVPSPRHWPAGFSSPLDALWLEPPRCQAPGAVWTRAVPWRVSTCGCTISCCLAFSIAACGVCSLGFRAVLILTAVTGVCRVRSWRIFPLNFRIVQGLVWRLTFNEFFFIPSVVSFEPLTLSRLSSHIFPSAVFPPSSLFVPSRHGPCCSYHLLPLRCCLEPSPCLSWLALCSLLPLHPI